MTSSPQIDKKDSSKATGITTRARKWAFYYKDDHSLNEVTKELKQAIRQYEKKYNLDDIIKGAIVNKIERHILVEFHGLVDRTVLMKPKSILTSTLSGWPTPKVDIMTLFRSKKEMNYEILDQFGGWGGFGEMHGELKQASKVLELMMNPTFQAILVNLCQGWPINDLLFMAMGSTKHGADIHNILTDQDVQFIFHSFETLMRKKNLINYELTFNRRQQTYSKEGEVFIKSENTLKQEEGEVFIKSENTLKQEEGENNQKILKFYANMPMDPSMYVSSFCPLGISPFLRK